MYNKFGEIHKINDDRIVLFIKSHLHPQFLHCFTNIYNTVHKYK
jgi:hypothetical protein